MAILEQFMAQSKLEQIREETERKKQKKHKHTTKKIYKG